MSDSHGVEYPVNANEDNKVAAIGVVLIVYLFNGFDFIFFISVIERQYNSN